MKSYLVQGKTLIRPLETGSYGFGFAFGITRPDHGRGGADYAYVPLSLMSSTGRAVVHFNLGWLRDHVLRASRTTWGLGAEYACTERVSVFGEVFGDDATDPKLRAGFSFGLIPDRIQLDTTYGHSTAAAHDSDFYSIGINIYMPPF